MLKAKGSVFIATSLDGFIARPDGSLDWLPQPPEGEAEDYGYERFMASVDALVMGRHSFEKVLSFGEWPYGKKPVIVLTSHPAGLTLPPHLSDTVRVMTGTPLHIASVLAAEGFRDLYIDGGRTIQRFLASGLIHRLIITRIPILLGQGIPLFGAQSADIPVSHHRTQTFPNGLVQSEYHLTPTTPETPPPPDLASPHGCGTNP